MKTFCLWPEWVCPNILAALRRSRIRQNAGDWCPTRVLGERGYRKERVVGPTRAPLRSFLIKSG